MDAARALPGQNPDGSDDHAISPPSWTVDERVTARDRPAGARDPGDPADGHRSAGESGPVHGGPTDAVAAAGDATDTVVAAGDATDTVAPAGTAAEALAAAGAAAEALAANDRATDTGNPADPAELTARDRKILEFEHHWWRYAGAKEQAIRTAFSVSATRYYQLLNSLIDKPAALVADPMLVRRLRRLRADRRHSRAGRPRPSGI
ncbi:MAG: DUF3263 domain-containing protein [Frankia sp.]